MGGSAESAVQQAIEGREEFVKVTGAFGFRQAEVLELRITGLVCSSRRDS